MSGNANTAIEIGMIFTNASSLPCHSYLAKCLDLFAGMTRHGRKAQSSDRNRAAPDPLGKNLT
jgi:hypothetical protein